MKISHEVPICLLEDSKQFNDYDYCLLHLLKKPEYLNYYKKASEEGREIILDNSLFELGDSLSPEELIEGINLIKPTWYVVPDCLHNIDTTIQRFDNWKEHYQSKVSGKAIGVVQGSNLKEMIECYKYMARVADKIAIPGFLSAYNTMFTDIETLTERQSLGRNYFIKHLMAEGIFDYNKPVHILGSSAPGEFLDPIYRRYVDSVDTSCPITNGIAKNIISINTYTKPKELLADLIDIELDDAQRSIIYRNIKTFRNICEGGI